MVAANYAVTSYNKYCIFDLYLQLLQSLNFSQLMILCNFSDFFCIIWNKD